MSGENFRPTKNYRKIRSDRVISLDSRMPINRDIEDNYVIAPKTVQHLNYNPNRSHVGSYPREIQLFPMELRPVVDDQQKKKLDFYNEMRSRKLEEQRKREEEMMEHHQQQMPEKRYRIPRRPRGCDDETCPALNRSSCTQGSDVYRNILGPTPDESILAGLQTVIEICGLSDICHLDSDATDSRLLTSSSRNSTYTQDYSLRRTSSDSSQDDTYSSRPRHPSETPWCPIGRRPWHRCDQHDPCSQRCHRNLHYVPRECISPCPLSRLPPPCPGSHIGDTLPSTSFHCGLRNCPVPVYKGDRRPEKKGTIALESNLRDMKNKSLFSHRTETSLTGLTPSRLKHDSSAQKKDAIAIAESDTQTIPIRRSNMGTTMGKDKSAEIRNILKPEHERRGSGESTPKKLSFLTKDGVERSSPQSSTSLFINKGSSYKQKAESEEKLVQVFEGSPSKDLGTKEILERPSERIRERKSDRIFKPSKHVKSITSLQSYQELSSSLLSMKGETKQDYKVKQKASTSHSHRKSFPYQNVSKAELVKKLEQDQKYHIKTKLSIPSALQPRPYQTPSKAELIKTLDETQKYFMRKAMSSATMFKRTNPYEQVMRGEVCKKGEQGQKYFIRKAMSSVTFLKRPGAMEKQSYVFPGQTELTKRAYIDQKMNLNTSLHTAPSSTHQSYQTAKEMLQLKEDCKKGCRKRDCDDECRRTKCQTNKDDCKEGCRKRDCDDECRRTKCHTVEDDCKEGCRKRDCDEECRRTKCHTVMQDDCKEGCTKRDCDDECRRTKCHTIIQDDCKEGCTKKDCDDECRRTKCRTVIQDDCKEGCSKKDCNEECRRTQCKRSTIQDDCKEGCTKRDCDDECRRTKCRTVIPDDCKEGCSKKDCTEECKRTKCKRPVIHDDCKDGCTKRDCDDECRRTKCHTVIPDDCKEGCTKKDCDDECRRTKCRTVIPDDCKESCTKRDCDDECRRTKCHTLVQDDCKEGCKKRDCDDECRRTKCRTVIPDDCKIGCRKRDCDDECRHTKCHTVKDSCKEGCKKLDCDDECRRTKCRTLDTTRHLSFPTVGFKENIDEQHGDLSCQGRRKMNKSCCCVDKCCGPSPHERFPWFKLRLNKSMSSGRSWSVTMRRSSNLTVQNFPPITLPSSSKSVNYTSCFNNGCKCIPGQCICSECHCITPRTEYLYRGRESQKSVVVQDPKKFSTNSSLFDRKFVCNKDYVFPCENTKKVKDFRTSGMSIPPIVQPVVGVCTDGKCGNGTTNEKLLNVRYSLVRISTFTDYTTYEILKSSAKKPRKMPCIVEGIFVTKR